MVIDGLIENLPETHGFRYDFGVCQFILLNISMFCAGFPQLKTPAHLRQVSVASWMISFYGAEELEVTSVKPWHFTKLLL